MSRIYREYLNAGLDFFFPFHCYFGCISSVIQKNATSQLTYLRSVSYYWKREEWVVTASKIMKSQVFYMISANNYNICRCSISETATLSLWSAVVGWAWPAATRLPTYPPPTPPPQQDRDNVGGVQLALMLLVRWLNNW